MAFLEIRPDELVVPRGYVRDRPPAVVPVPRSRVSESRSHEFVPVGLEPPMIEVNPPPPPPGRRPTHVPVRDIIKACANEFQISPTDILSHRRTLNVIVPRQIAMYLTKKLTVLSLPQIGLRFRRDHTTVIHAIRKISTKLGSDVVFARLVYDIETSIVGAEIEK